MTTKKTGSGKEGRGRPKVMAFLPWVLAGALVVAVAAGLVLMKGTGSAAGFQKGIGYVTWSSDAYQSPESDESLKRLKETGADWASVLVTWYQSNCWSTDISRAANTPSDESVVHAIRKAHELGLKVMLKLHLDLLDTQDGSWRGEIGCVKEADWDKWFAAYTEYLMYYTDMADRENVEMLCVGTELTNTATVKGYVWREMIGKVRQNYKGLLTFAAHWDTYQDIRFWDMMDYVGINAYFPLSEELTPSYEVMKEAWKKWLDEITQFQLQVKKPIIFPEAGCSSADGAAIRPWEHAPVREVNLKLQEDYYKAMLETFWDKEWFYGLYWWYWGTNPNMGGKYNRGFTPQNKPVEKVIKEWYAKPVRREQPKK